jgi:hypothetical protein
MAPTSQGVALGGPAAELLQRGRPCCSAPAPRTSAVRAARRRTELPHRRERLPRPAVPARAGGPAQAAGAARAGGADAAVGRVRLPAQPRPIGEVDLVVGNWLEPPGELHLGRLLSDEVVCLVGRRPPRGAHDRNPRRQPRLERRQVRGLRAHGADAHFAPRRHRRDRRTPHQPGAAARHRGAQRALWPDPSDGGAARTWCSPPAASSAVVMSTLMPVRIVRCPVPFPPLTYYQLWHDVSHTQRRDALAARTGARRRARRSRHKACSGVPPRRARPPTRRTESPATPPSCSCP